MVETQSNVPEYSVSDIAGAIKDIVEDRFPFIRVRGEISGLKRAASGHIYFSMKDEKSIIDSVCWKGVASNLTYAPEDGMEMIATGKITTFPGRSKYQLVINALEPAGEGALMALLEKRKKMLTAEGLFDASRKQELPTLPQRIGVITSPTGAVIQDILHRISERFPRHVQVWPVLVQGELASTQITHALTAFPKLPEAMRPDLIIIARGGGSLEDLWPFNEESVVRAVANCPIATISAVGHETDTTLCDYAADKRAPTPTAAAEMAVPVRAELATHIQHIDERLLRRMTERLDRQQLTLHARTLPPPSARIDSAQHTLSQRCQTMHYAMQWHWHKSQEQLQKLASQLPTPRHWLDVQSHKLAQLGNQLERSLPSITQTHRRKLDQLSGRLQPTGLRHLTQQHRTHLHHRSERLWELTLHALNQHQQQLERHTTALNLLDVQQILQRGFALVQSDDGHALTSAKAAKKHGSLSLTFHDGSLQTFSQAPAPTKPKKTTRKPVQTDLIDFLKE